MKIKQGTVLPSTGIGIGYLMLLVYGVMIYYWGSDYILHEPATYALPLLFILMQFTYKDVEIADSGEGYRFVFRILFIPFKGKKHAWDEYSFFVLRVLNKQYNVARAAVGGIQSGTHVDSRVVITGKKKNSKEVVVICSGKKNQLYQVINTCILPVNTEVYMGVRKKGYEYMSKQS